MNKVSELDEKIAKLQKQKESLQKKVSMSLLKGLSSILREDFSPELVLSIVSESWSSANEKTKEAWQEKASTFHKNKKSGKRSKDKADWSATRFTWSKKV